MRSNDGDRDRDVIPFKTGAEAHAAWRMLV